MLTVLDNTDDNEDGESDCLLGHVVIDLDNLDPESGYHSSFPLTDMVCNHQQIYQRVGLFIA